MSHIKLNLPDDDLVPLLRSASSEDLGILAEIIIKTSTNELSDVPEFRRQHPDIDGGTFNKNAHHNIYVDDISAEIQKFGGNSIINVFRGGRGVVYAEIVRDVADKLDVNYSKDASVAAIESQIQIKFLEEAYSKMSDEEKRDVLNSLKIENIASLPSVLPIAAVQGLIRAGGFASYKIALIVANYVARLIIGRGITFAGNAALVRGISLFAGPIGWTITGIWTAFDLASPAYRVTIPCVLQVAYIRQKANAILCGKCGSVIAEDSKFCGQCGEPA